MPQRIVITGTGKTDCFRVREVLRQRFKQAIIHVNDGPIAELPKDGILVFADSLEAGSIQTRESAELEKKIHRAEFLVETARILSSTDTLDAMLSEAVAKSRGVLGDIAFVILMDEGRPRLQCATSKDPENLIRALISVVNSRSQILQRQLQRILESGETLFIRDLAKAELSEEIERFVKASHLKSIVAAPVRRGEKVFGIFVSMSSPLWWCGVCVSGPDVPVEGSSPGESRSVHTTLTCRACPPQNPLFPWGIARVLHRRSAHLRSLQPPTPRIQYPVTDGADSGLV